MLELYHILVRMLYLEPEWIQAGPHDLGALMPLYESLNIDSSIIYLYHILPYVKTPPSDWDRNVFLWGATSPTSATRTLDTPEEMMRPWMTPLSAMGNHQCVILYDAKRHVVGIFDQLYPGSYDHNKTEGVIQGYLPGTEHMYFICKDGIETPCDVFEWEKYVNEQGTDSDSDGEEDGEEEADSDADEEDEDKNIWNEMEGRPARRVLRDIVRWYHELRETPGGGENAGAEWDHDLVRPLYRKHGWPGEDFDADAFLVDQKIRLIGFDIAESERKRALAMPKWQEKLAEAKTIDEEWLLSTTLSSYSRASVALGLSEPETARAYRAVTEDFERRTAIIKDSEEEMTGIQEWMKQLPDGTCEARGLALEPFLHQSLARPLTDPNKERPDRAI
ncbi:hypothetical protein N658DRAFT_560318 [Parathielavia hyrcaniae]|uniref:Uncharacterized protein n=1 Tax=Parathielavia hyrcaniae TaxID=113614 RepID=A0AAN6T0H6_9PEZI|nr:hypothetical protein N658DRAFT_560318 [Parathielavia hyrcaniae]